MMLTKRELYRLNKIGVVFFPGKLLFQNSANPAELLFQYPFSAISDLSLIMTGERDHSQGQTIGFRLFGRYEAPVIYRLTVTLNNGIKRYSRMTDIDLISTRKALQKLTTIIKEENERN